MLEDRFQVRSFCRGWEMSFHWNLQQGLEAQQAVEPSHISGKRRRSIDLRRIEIGGEQRDVTISLVESQENISAACDLVNDRYAWRGYGTGHSIQSDAHHMTFNAEVDGQLVATLTLAVDSQDGMAADKAFKDEIDGFRAVAGVKVCELTKFAIDPNVQSKELMAALFHIVFVYGHRTHAATDLFIEVNPRHVRFYEAMLGFQRVGALKVNESVAAPAQLMWLKVSEIRDHINRTDGVRSANSRSLYPFFFSPAEEDGIYRRLTRAGKRTPVQAPAPAISATPISTPAIYLAA